MDINELIGFIDFLINEEYEQRMFQRWIAGPQFEMDFEEFKARCKPQKARSEEDILQEVYAAFENVKGV